MGPQTTATIRTTGYLVTPVELAAILRALHLGPVQAARDLGIAYPTLWKYLKGNLTIPGPVATATRALLRVAQLEGRAP